MNVSGQAAIITGGGTGIGFAIAKLLSEKGANVSIAGRTQAVIGEAGAKIGALALSCDVSDEKSTLDAFEKTKEKNGPVRILINNAAITLPPRSVFDENGPVPLNWFTDVIATNLTGVFNATRLAVAQMYKSAELEDGSRGVIINISSVSAEDGLPNDAAYVASKGAINALTLALAREFGEFGVRVMTVSSGPIDTTRSRRDIPLEMWDALPQAIPFPKRAGLPEEVAKLVLHICEQPFLNGEVIRIEGGYRIPFISEEH